MPDIQIKKEDLPDTLVVHEKRLGPGYRFAVRAVVYIFSAVFFMFAGMTWVKLEHSENDTIILKQDSIVEAEIRRQDELLLEEGKALIKKLGNVYDADGNPKPEWVQFIKRQRAIARARSNNATVSERATYMHEKIREVWQ